METEEGEVHPSLEEVVEVEVHPSLEKVVEGEVHPSLEAVEEEGEVQPFLVVAEVVVEVEAEPVENCLTRTSEEVAEDHYLQMDTEKGEGHRAEVPD